LNKIVIVAKARASDGLTVNASLPYDGETSLGDSRWSLANPKGRRLGLKVESLFPLEKPQRFTELQAAWSWPTTSD